MQNSRQGYEPPRADLAPGGAPEAQVHRLEDGDRLLLCTDGLTNMLDDHAISDIVSSTDSVGDGCQRLVDEALQRGGMDNVTVILAQYSLPSRK